MGEGGYFLGYFAQFVVPCFAKLQDEGLLQEDVQRDAQFFSFEHSVFADVPPMVVYPHQSSAKFLHADGVEVATDGFAP